MEKETINEDNIAYQILYDLIDLYSNAQTDIINARNNDSDRVDYCIGISFGLSKALEAVDMNIKKMKMKGGEN